MKNTKEERKLESSEKPKKLLSKKYDRQRTTSSSWACCSGEKRTESFVSVQSQRKLKVSELRIKRTHSEHQDEPVPLMILDTPDFQNKEELRKSKGK